MTYSMGWGYDGARGRDYKFVIPFWNDPIQFTSCPLLTRVCTCSFNFSRFSITSMPRGVYVDFLITDSSCLITLMLKSSMNRYNGIIIAIWYIIFIISFFPASLIISSGSAMSELSNSPLLLLLSKSIPIPSSCSSNNIWYTQDS